MLKWVSNCTKNLQDYEKNSNGTTKCYRFGKVVEWVELKDCKELLSLNKNEPQKGKEIAEAPT